MRTHLLGVTGLVAVLVPLACGETSSPPPDAAAGFSFSVAVSRIGTRIARLDGEEFRQDEEGRTVATIEFASYGEALASQPFLVTLWEGENMVTSLEVNASRCEEFFCPQDPWCSEGALVEELLELDFDVATGELFLHCFTCWWDGGAATLCS